MANAYSTCHPSKQETILMDADAIRRAGRAIDRATIATSKLEALICAMGGEAMEGFECMNQDLRQAYILACADLAADAKRELGQATLLRAVARADET
ncbi:hypothetical protein ACU4HD_21880 [Cupriavidus basilensis]